MNQLYDQALVAAGIDVTYQVHSGGHDIPDFLNEIKAMLRWGLFKPVSPTRSWGNQTAATRGQLWDFDYRFARPPTQIVKFRQSGARCRSVPRDRPSPSPRMPVEHSHSYPSDCSGSEPQLHVGGTHFGAAK